jgi:hypothetical protein
MDLAKEPFEWIGRAQLNVNAPDTELEASRNFKKPQSDLTNLGVL